MWTRRFALIIGVAYVLAGVAGFIPFLSPLAGAGAPDVLFNSTHRHALGLFPVNLLHNIVHLTVGALGLTLARTYIGARNFARGLAVFYGLLAVLGLIPALNLNTTFGLIPIYGNDVWLHAVSAALAAYFGWFSPPEHTFVDAGRQSRGRA